MSLRARLAILISVVVAVGIGVASTTSYISTRTELHDEIDRFLKVRANELVEGAREIPGEGNRRRDDDAIEDTVRSLPFDPDAIVQALDENGDMVASSGGELPVSPSDRDIAERMLPPKLRTVEIDGVDVRMITEHIAGGGAIQVGRSLEETQGVLAGLRDRSILTGVVLSLLAAAVGWFVAARTLRPLRSLSDAAGRVAVTEDFATPVGIDRDDEVGRLAASFDDMLAALARSREQQHRLVQDAGHELRTPLTTLRANIDLLARAPALEEPARSEVLASLQSEVTELNELFTELIELATDVHAEEPFDDLELDDVARRALDRFRTRTPRVVQASFAGSTVRGNAELIERAVSNLLHNADKFSPPSERILLTVEGPSVTVSDRGPGIPATERERVFDRFYRSEAARTMSGSGLGLAIVKHIVDRHGGEVWIREAAGGGAEVGFRIGEPPS